jgi:hypothetical protein
MRNDEFYTCPDCRLPFPLCTCDDFDFDEDMHEDDEGLDPEPELAG